MITAEDAVTLTDPPGVLVVGEFVVSKSTVRGGATSAV